MIIRIRLLFGVLALTVLLETSVGLRLQSARTSAAENVKQETATSKVQQWSAKPQNQPTLTTKPLKSKSVLKRRKMNAGALNRRKIISLAPKRRNLDLLPAERRQAIYGSNPPAVIRIVKAPNTALTAMKDPTSSPDIRMCKYIKKLFNRQQSFTLPWWYHICQDLLKNETNKNENAKLSVLQKYQNRYRNQKQKEEFQKIKKVIGFNQDNFQGSYENRRRSV